MRQGLLPGLDASLCNKLAQKHVLTVEALCDVPVRDLAHEMGVPFLALLELQCEATRHTAAREPGFPGNE